MAAQGLDLQYEELLYIFIKITADYNQLGCLTELQAHMIQNIDKLFAAVMLCSILTYFHRADYNLPLFAFAAILWDHRRPPQKTRIWYLVLFSILVDFIWILYWTVIWSELGGSREALRAFTLLASVLVFLLKIGLAIILFMRDRTCQKAILELPNNVRELIRGGTPQEIENQI